MVTILPPVRRESFSSLLGRGVGEHLNQRAQSRMQQEAIQAQEAQKMRLLEHEYGLKGKIEKEKFSNEIIQNRAIIKDLEKQRGLPEGSLSAYESDPKMAEQVTR